jgi:hypothetical protein
MYEKVARMRAEKEAKAKEEAKIAELKRREEGSKNVAALEAMRKAEVEREAERRKREKVERERDLNKAKLEAAKNQAEREAQTGPVSAATMAEIRLLQDLVDGKTPVLQAADIPGELQKQVNGLTFQKVESIGRNAADLLVAVLTNVLTKPDDKYKRLPFDVDKKAYPILQQAPNSKAILSIVGWAIETFEEEGKTRTFFTLSSETLEKNRAHMEHVISLIKAAIAAGKL